MGRGGLRLGKQARAVPPTRKPRAADKVDRLIQEGLRRASRLADDAVGTRAKTRGTRKLWRPYDPGNKRVVTMEGQRFALLGRNQAVVLVPDIIACDGILHVVDSVLITPALTTLRQLTLRPEISLFTQIVTSPGNEALALELDTVGTFGQLVTGIAIFAPTNAAVEGTLAYLVRQENDFFQAQPPT